jgi:hypothetical protein
MGSLLQFDDRIGKDRVVGHPLADHQDQGAMVDQLNSTTYLTYKSEC